MKHGTKWASMKLNQWSEWQVLHDSGANRKAVLAALCPEERKRLRDFLKKEHMRWKATRRLLLATLELGCPCFFVLLPWLLVNFSMVCIPSHQSFDVAAAIERLLTSGFGHGVVPAAGFC